MVDHLATEARLLAGPPAGVADQLAGDLRSLLGELEPDAAAG